MHYSNPALKASQSFAPGSPDRYNKRVLFRSRPLPLLASAVFLLHAGVPQPPPPPGKASVDVLRTVLSDLQDYDRQGRPSEDRRISFELPEALVNQYLEIALAVTPRPMVEGLHLTLLGDNLCAVEAR